MKSLLEWVIQSFAKQIDKSFLAVGSFFVVIGRSQFHKGKIAIAVC
jgi:hypothetical protein